MIWKVSLYLMAFLKSKLVRSLATSLIMFYILHSHLINMAFKLDVDQ